MNNDAGGLYFNKNQAAIYTMTLRDYFAAHAPKDPQSWFEPDLKGIFAPTVGFKSLKKIIHSSASQEEKNEAVNEANRRKAIIAAERRKQWPYAWADMMISERKRK